MMVGIVENSILHSFEADETERILLVPLSVADAGFLFRMYTDPAVAEGYRDPPFADGESPGAFAGRLIAFCQAIFTIRLIERPDEAIGDCALHHWKPEAKEIEIGGSLLPEYWGMGLMQEAFELLAESAGKKFGVNAFIGNTELTNLKAARLVEKMGFERYRIEAGNQLFRKEI